LSGGVLRGKLEGVGAGLKFEISHIPLLIRLEKYKKEQMRLQQYNSVVSLGKSFLILFIFVCKKVLFMLIA